jgi:hypothetical protein
MSDLTLESLAKRVEALEKVIATKGPDQSSKDWRKVVGMFRDSEFMRKVDEECLRAREAELTASCFPSPVSIPPSWKNCSRPGFRP